MAELKPCPFCGSPAIAAEINFIDKYFCIFCAGDAECIAEMRFSFADAGIGDGLIIDFAEIQKIMDELIEAWNRRADDVR